MANLQLSSVQLVHIGPGQGFFPFGAVPRGIPKSEILRINVRSRLCPKFQIWGRTSLDSCLWRKLMTLCYAMAVSFSGDRSAVIHRNFVIHNLHSTLPLIVIVLSRLHTVIQSATETLPSHGRGDEGVAHSFNCTSPSYDGFLSCWCTCGKILLEVWTVLEMCICVT